MERGLDPQMQRILNNAARTSQDGRGDGFNYSSEEPRTSEWSYAPGPKPRMRDSVQYNGFGESPAAKGHCIRLIEFRLQVKHHSIHLLLPSKLSVQNRDPTDRLFHRRTYTQPRSESQGSLQTRNIASRSERLFIRVSPSASLVPEQVLPHTLIRLGNWQQRCCYSSL